jgi:hypothetical protein
MGPPPLSIGLKRVDIRIAVAAFNCCSGVGRRYDSLFPSPQPIASRWSRPGLIMSPGLSPPSLALGTSHAHDALPHDDLVKAAMTARYGAAEFSARTNFTN